MRQFNIRQAISRRALELAKRSTLLMLLIRRYRRWRQLKNGRFPNWEKLSVLEQFDANQAVHKPTTQRVLIATSLGAHAPSLILESTIGVALQQRNVQVDLMLCDKVLPACLDCEYMKFPTERLKASFIKSGPKELCRSCFDPASKALNGSGIHLRTYSESIAASDYEVARQLAEELALTDIRTFQYKGAAVGEHAYAGTLRFFGRGDLDGLAQGEKILRRYLEAAILSSMAMTRLLETEKYNVVVLNHGIYVPHGIVAEVARLHKIRVVTWNPGYRRGCFLFSHGDTYHHTMMMEPVDQWMNMYWSDKLENKTMEYLKSRWTGAQDWIWFHDRPFFDTDAIEKEIGVDFSKPCIGMLTNVIWDAQLHYPANAFDNMVEWVIGTIDYFTRRPDLQLLIRVHPAEINGGVPSKQTVVEEIAKRYSILPKNVFIIPPESHVSTYAAMMKCNSVLIYGTKMGVELSSVGMPVIVAGEAWIRNKGLTIDVVSRKDYYAKLDQLPMACSMMPEIVSLARKYAFHFFFRRMIPLNIVEPTNDWPPYKVSITTVRDLGPERDPGLDVICDGILTGSPFVYKAEEIEEKAAIKINQHGESQIQTRAAI